VKPGQAKPQPTNRKKAAGARARTRFSKPVTSKKKTKPTHKKPVTRKTKR
jgi:hypothetical protein